ncbi:MAG TPA: hypothetical protein VG963_26945, partial [Polyangiaceae bacterium]|nr:hypothetical protein [Polyangiaceae bacterium]
TDGSAEQIDVTGEHPFHVYGRGWVFARNLQHNDEVELISGETLRVVSMEQLPDRITVYNFEVEVTCSRNFGPADARKVTSPAIGENDAQEPIHG